MVLMLFSIPSSSVNSALDYLNKKIALCFRQRLMNHFHNRYVQNMIYYQICNLDSRIANPDQRLTQDIQKWSDSLSQLYSNISKPMLDIVLFSRKMAELMGWQGPALVIFWYIISGFMIKFISPPFGKLTALEQKLEGEFRTTHTDLLNHAEEIAFYNGDNWEKTRVNRKFKELYKHIDGVIEKRFYMGIFDYVLVKYGAVMIGYAVLGFPVFGPGKEEYMKKVGTDAATITKDYIRNSGLLINLAKAIGRLLVSYKEVQNLAGYTSLVYELKEVLDDLEAGKYNRTMVTGSNAAGNDDPQEKGRARKHGKGEVVIEKTIHFENVPIVSPNGDTLIESINFECKPGVHLIIIGPNGCGKSSLFRIMGGLWPVFGGKLHKPQQEEIFYIPQRPYLPTGTLRDQVIYPHTHDIQLNKKHVSDNVSIFSRDRIGP